VNLGPFLSTSLTIDLIGQGVPFHHHIFLLSLLYTKVLHVIHLYELRRSLPHLLHRLQFFAAYFVHKDARLQAIKEVMLGDLVAEILDFD